MNLHLAPLLFAALLLTAFSSSAENKEFLPISTFQEILLSDVENVEKSLLRIDQNWRDSYAAILIESFRFSKRQNVRGAILDLLYKKTQLSQDSDLSDWWQWAWQQPSPPHPDYAEFKTSLYERIDIRFGEYFDDQPEALIRLDEVRWGGVLRDGIPPLKDPTTIPASEADYLKDDHIVFGVSFDGHARAYPKRILAWHEMVKDTVGGQSINGVYCTLCGSMIVYDPIYKGTHYELGTSGFLYRSNKLMYDHSTQSMWSTLEGKPVVGPLVGKGIALKPLHVVTTTWGEWLRRHPETSVLSLKTGYRRDYGEGAAYREYFATDRVMFDIPLQFKDRRLKNKASIFALRFGPKAKDTAAFSPKVLRKNPLFLYRHEDSDPSLVILTDRSGASRAYHADELQFQSWDQKETLIDEEGNKWSLREDSLINEGGRKLARYPAHNAFWFGWRSAYPETRLINKL